MGVTGHQLAAVQTEDPCTLCPGAAGCVIGSAVKEAWGAPSRHPVRMQLLHRGDTLFHCGDDIEHLHILRAGSLKTVVLTQAGEEHVIRFCYPGDLPGIDDAGGRIHQSSVCALETSSVCRLPLRSFHDLLDTDPGFRRHVLAHFRFQLRKAAQHTLTLATYSAAARVAGFLLDVSQIQHACGYPRDQAHLSMSRHEIASYLGMSAETASRIMAGLQETGRISSHAKHVVIRDVAGLRELSGRCRAEVPQASVRP